VNVARIIVGLPHDPDVYQGAALGIDPNHEHPPLAKLIIALSVSLLGDNAYGFRVPSVIFGIAGILIFYLLMKRISRNYALAFISTFLFSFDNLVFVHGRIATLDIFMLTFMLLGFHWYFGGRTVLSAVGFALATLCKIGGVYGFAVIVLYHFLKDAWRGGKWEWRVKLQWLERFTLSYVIAGLALLAVLDRIWGGYANPFDHVTFIYNYTKALVREAPEGIESYPWQWLLNEVKIPYLTVNVNYYSGGVVVGTSTIVAFQGAMNPLIIFLCIPSLGYMAYTYLRSRNEFPLFILLWFCLTYIPFFPMSIFMHRIMYLFYFLNTVPSVCGAIAFMMVDQKPPRIVVLAYLVAVLAAFAMLFPFKTVP